LSKNNLWCNRREGHAERGWLVFAVKSIVINPPAAYLPALGNSGVVIAQASARSANFSFSAFLNRDALPFLRISRAMAE